MELVDWVKELLVNYGTANVIIMFLVIILTNVIKRPIIDKADVFVAKAKKLTGIDVDKSVITSNIVYIPIGLTFVLQFIYLIILNKFNFTTIDYAALCANSVFYGGLSISVYEIGKIKIKSFVSKKSYTDAKTQLSELNKAQEIESEHSVKDTSEEAVSGDLLQNNQEEAQHD